ncbi:aldo/keto reductase [Amycolatopsis aidingensis]|uniref:aldo/keto reductase n=1 Tax=Amycolatopsis aidingensis TaxID=2842453 RepID=UPI001C0BF84F|nr:aldo/keto reductase [Amycolatopsis aidingensis]
MTTSTNTAAATWHLGDHMVNRLGLGAMRLFHHTDGDSSERERALTVLRRAVELGINHIDTAAFYFSPRYSANELINSALRPYPEDLLIATKVGPGRDASGEWLPAARPGQLRGQVEENLRQLGRDHLDLVYLRIGEGLERGTGSLAERFGALAELREAGLIRHLGISNIGPEHLTEARRIAPVVAVQNQYGPANRADDALLDTCTEHGIAFVPFFGVVGGDPGGRVAGLAGERGVSPAQLLLAWSLRRAPNVLAIPGTGNPEHLEQNVAAAGIELSAAELDRLGGG